MALDPSTISEVVAVVSAIAASGGLGGAIHTKKRNTKLEVKIAKLETEQKNTNKFIAEVKTDIKDIKQILMERK